MKVILAEKPSVAKTIASFLKANTRRDGYFEGNGYIVTYAFGHLVSLYDMKDYDKEKYSGSWKMANFPFIPADKFKFKVDDSKQKQFNIIKELLNRDDVEYVINATDNDREGELIAFLIFLLAKNKKPVKSVGNRCGHGQKFLTGLHLLHYLSVMDVKEDGTTSVFFSPYIQRHSVRRSS